MILDTDLDYFTPSQAASLLGVTPKRITQLANSGRLRCVRTPLGRLFPRAIVRDFALGRGIRIP